MYIFHDYMCALMSYFPEWRIEKCLLHSVQCAKCSPFGDLPTYSNCFSYSSLNF